MDWTEYPRLALVVLLVITNAGLVVAMSSSTVPYGPTNTDWDGGSTLRTEITAAGATPEITRTTDSYVGRGTDSVGFIIAPTDEYGPGDTARVRQFVTRGNTLLVAGERDNTTNQLLAELDVSTRINGTSVRDDQNTYRNASLPVAPNVSDHPLTTDVDALTLNRGTVLDLPNETLGADSSNVDILVRTSQVSYLDRNGNGTLDDDEPIDSYPVAAVESVGDGRVIVVSDASIFTNAMLEREGNAAFTRAVSRNATTALIDYSHRPPLPPLTYLSLVVRDTPALQIALIIVTLSVVGRWARRPTLPFPDRIRALTGTQRPEPDHELSEDDIVAFVRSQHPDWDTDRVERVSQHIIRRREDG